MIKVENLSYTYRNAKTPALKQLNFQINKGEIFGFLGPSGAGKSTAQKVLYKILGGYEGQVTLDGVPINKLDKSYFERIGVGFELPNHYLKLTGRENLDLFASFYPKKQLQDITALFALVGMEDSMHQPVEAYSKGMKMRLNFIRAIMHDPEILFFDEPTAGLDPVNAHIIKQYIQQLKAAGKTIFITTHNMNTADELCDRVAFIVDGGLRLIDAPAALKQRYGRQVVQVRLASGLVEEFPLSGLGGNASFSSFIKQAEVQRIATLEATLEEVFIKTTGKALQA